MIAFSGGVDSTYLMSVAKEALGQNCKGVFARGAMISAREQESALALAQTYGFPLEVVDVDVLNLAAFRDNPPDRCYFCKKELFQGFLDLTHRSGFTVLAEGTNASDVGDYRPGRRALQELKVHSPLLEVGLTKAEIRLLSKRRGLETWNKPSMACLASRVPYGEAITAELLAKIAEAEAVLHDHGFPESRFRVHGEIARIEIPPAHFAEFMEKQTEIVQSLKPLGFKFITLDLEGLRSGSLNPGSVEAAR